MPIFKVTIERPIKQYGQRGINPFVRKVSPDDKIHYSIREWEFEAKNESEVRGLFAEALEGNYENVRGYSLRNIEQL